MVADHQGDEFKGRIKRKGVRSGAQADQIPLAGIFFYMQLTLHFYWLNNFTEMAPAGHAASGAFVQTFAARPFRL
jgi:hypothetical protein